MPPIRRLKVLQDAPPDEDRPAWHWAVIGVVFILSIWAPLAMLSSWVARRVSHLIVGDLPPDELSLRLADASASARFWLWFVLTVGPVLAYGLACWASGAMVGRFGGKAGPREAAVAGGGALVALAEEELSHFRRVFGELESRGVPLGLPPPDGYAAELRKTVRAHRDASRAPSQPVEALVDRLLVAALIEARSCERFRLLSDALRERGPADLCRFYEELLAAEARHFRTFVDLARQVAHPDASWVDARLREVARLEGEVASR